MKTGTKGSMNRDFSEIYDQENDVYYVSFKTGEPSYCVEVDDVLLIEVGLFTNLPTGFRILNFNKSKVHAVGIGVLQKKIKKTLSDKPLPSFTERSRAVDRALENVLTA
jgi:hypothetical protein